MTNFNSTYHQQDWLIPMPLTEIALETAQSFARQQPDSAKEKQVYLNTLAVFAVHNYLKILGIPSQLHEGDSWNPILRFADDLADLWVTDLGRLECRPIEPGEEICSVPATALLDRIGYVVVEVSPEEKLANLVGFTSCVETESLAVNKLQSLENLPDFLHNFRPLVELGQWLDDIYQAGWQSLAQVFASQPQPAFAFRGGKQDNQDTIERCKTIDLGRDGAQVLLIVKLTPISPEEMDIVLELKPIPGKTDLPTQLEFILCDEDGEVVFESNSKQNMYINFTGDVEDNFSVQIIADGVCIKEDFVV